METLQVEDIQKLADYFVVLKDGRIIGQFEKEELIEMHVWGNMVKMPRRKKFGNGCGRKLKKACNSL